MCLVRDQFEKWHDLTYGPCGTRLTNGRYSSWSKQERWEGWVAREQFFKPKLQQKSPQQQKGQHKQGQNAKPKHSNQRQQNHRNKAP
nr:hypothetical protein [uncultured Acinetobacter sp.]